LDLAVSPDVPAWLCYLLIFIISLCVAIRKVAARLRSLTGDDGGGLGETPAIWHFSGTWILLASYTAIPLVLFWVLDRTQAIHDTSLLSALIIAFTYERIMAGKHSSLKVGEEVGGFWRPFQSFASHTTRRVTHQLQQAANRFDRKVLQTVSEDQQRMAKLESLAQHLTKNRVQLDDQLQKVGTAPNQLDHSYIQERRAQILYAEIHGSELFAGGDRWQRHLVDTGVISQNIYLLYSPKIRSRVAATLASLAVSSGLAVGWLHFDQPDVWNQYYLWRLTKPFTTPSDLYRSEFHLAKNLANESTGRPTFAMLTQTLKDPSLLIDRADLILSVLTAARCESLQQSVDLGAQLSDALHTSSTDVRARIHQVLMYIAGTDNLNQELKDWRPTAGDSVVSLERHVQQWQEFWDGPGSPAACGARKRMASASSEPSISPARYQRDRPHQIDSNDARLVICPSECGLASRPRIRAHYDCSNLRGTGSGGRVISVTCRSRISGRNWRSRR
jgi:hypothetical protein